MSINASCGAITRRLDEGGSVVHGACLVAEPLEQGPEQRRGVFVVVNDEHTRPLLRPLCPPRRSCSFGLARRLAVEHRVDIFWGSGAASGVGSAVERQSDGECRARASARAGGGHTAAVQFDEAAHERKAEAEAARGARERLPFLHEEVEHARQHLRVDADAGVDHLQQRLLAFALGGDGDRALGFHVLGRVGEQVRDDLRQPCRIAID